MKFITRVYLSIRYRVNKLIYLFYSFYNKVVSIIIKPPKVINTEDTIDKIIKEKCSVSRYGEGEFKLMSGKDLLFQNSSKELILRMNEIIQSNNSNHLVCVPDVFKNLERFTDKAYKFWNTYLNTDRHYIYKLLDKNKVYGDSLMTRVYIDYKNKNNSELLFKKIKIIWNDRDITIVEGNKSRLGIGNDLFDNVKSINRILCPSENAFSRYNEIFHEVKKEDKDRLILIALGPTATILAYDLANEGYQAIDIGHIDIEYEWFLRRVNYKCPIDNKYVGEVINGTKVYELSNEIYKKEIKVEIS